ncbi:carbon storage regulator [Legionella erythra]|uniref:Translational regulator CsrA n=1 Tax=Legionella erythra TaxID=448 RepID=A0A0W0TRU0_LEGER|nr:carbon storage regulator [Legionella erythra]KTC98224.1 carbon storage regulator [Legionella erythra]
MLVMTRKLGEKIFIDKGKIKITVLRQKGGQVALGFSAPEEIEIDREEIYKRKLAYAQLPQLALRK